LFHLLGEAIFKKFALFYYICLSVLPAQAGGLSFKITAIFKYQALNKALKKSILYLPKSK